MKLATKLVGVAVAFGLSVSAVSAVELKFANFMPGGHPYVAGTFQPLADKIAEKTNGEVTVKIYSGGELGPGPVEQYSRAVDGVADLVVSLAGYTASTFPITLLAELPGVLEEETGTETIWNHIDLFAPEYKRVQLVSLWSSAVNLLYMRDKPVHAVADLQGLKIRVPSRNTGLLVEALGATPVSMPVSEIYNSMQTGVIDGAMIDGTATNAFKLGEVASYLTIGFKSTNSPFFILMNKDSFAALTEEQQAAVLEAGREVSPMGQNTQLTVAAGGIQAFADMEGKEVITLSGDALAEFNAIADSVTAQVVAEAEAEGLDAAAVVSALQGN